MTAQYVKGRGMYVTLDGFTVVLPEWWSVRVVENYLKEMREIYE